MISSSRAQQKGRSHAHSCGVENTKCNGGWVDSYDLCMYAGYGGTLVSWGGLVTCVVRQVGWGGGRGKGVGVECGEDRTLTRKSVKF